jgi:hypothetical protein
MRGERRVARRSVEEWKFSRTNKTCSGKSLWFLAGERESPAVACVRHSLARSVGLSKKRRVRHLCTVACVRVYALGRLCRVRGGRSALHGCRSFLSFGEKLPADLFFGSPVR